MSSRRRWMVADFLSRRQDATFQFDLAKAVLLDHLPAFAHRRIGTQNLSIFVRVMAIATAAGMLVKQIGGKRNGIPHATADDIADGPAYRFADNVQTGNFERRKGTVVLVERILARNQPSLRAAAGHTCAGLGWFRRFPI